MLIKFTHLGVEYEMTAEQIEAAYRYQKRQNRKQDAERQFLDFVYGDDPNNLELIDLQTQENYFLEEYGFSVEDGLKMLDAFVDRYEDLFDCNADENATWHDAIEQELGDTRK